ncbi:hypothetical protein EV700_0891 [Fluviicoccus keumensis]|uniref:DUF2059 domain-containing protein n=1 Tax=Fluviicoccus keumensis TaxID=1435465 RepID=A0A4Q7ZD15_9GAMM|nr:DUF2059 domain-containing protein [Fluviicoccus keumensis]RZU47923.1 hypothetical protein EV700_0891 [Fluviicoccus keumensis]
MNKTICLAFALIFLCSPSFAVEKSGTLEIARKIVELQGVREVLTQTNRQVDESIKVQAEQLYQQVVAANGGVEVAGAREVNDAFFASAAWHIPEDDFVARWAEAYSRRMTAQDLKAALAYYGSPAGQREVAATKLVSSDLTGWVLKETQTRMDKAVETYFKDMQALLAKSAKPLQ